MAGYEDFSKQQLIDRVNELEEILKKNQSNTLGFPLCCTLPSSNLSTTDFQEVNGSKILNALPDMLSVFDYNGNYIALASSEETVHVGNSSADLIGKNLAEILPPDQYVEVKKNFDKAITSGKASSAFHDLYVHEVLEHFENRFIPLDNRYVLCICRNISNRVKAQNELGMIKLAVDNSVDQIYATTTKGNLVFANKQFINSHHLSNNISDYSICDIYPEFDAASWQKHIQAIRDNGNVLKYTNKNKQDNGKYLQQEISVYIFKDSQNNEILWAFVRDISEKIEQETKINELNSLLDIILDNLPAYLFVKDTGNEFRYLYWNKAFEQYSHIPASKAIGYKDSEIFPSPEDVKKFEQDDLHLMTTKERIEFEEEYLAANDETRIVKTIKSLIPLKDKSPLLLGISWDITDLKKTEHELLQAKIKAEEADKLKSAFLANMSHEIRTPLNAIVGFSRLLSETEDLEERQQYYNIVDRNSELLLQLINDILDLSKIEAGIMEFTKQPVNLSSICKNLYESHLAKTPKDVCLVYDETDSPTTISTDANRLSQVISNLLTNAQKFTSKGEIRFGYTNEGHQIHFYVKDTGIGIPKSKQPEVFSRFIKLNSFIQGSGLGLPICEMIIRNLKGKIWLESTENVGTTFHFTIPVEKTKLSKIKEAKAISPQKEEQGATKKNILIAEDVESNFILLKVLLGKKYNLIWAKDGREAIAQFKTVNPDLILMDMKMPEVDGLEATRMIRQDSKTIPIIALTAFAFETDKEAALNAGCNEFLTKPVTSMDLYKTLDRYI